MVYSETNTVATVVKHTIMHIHALVYAQICCTGYEMARYKGTQASHLYEKSMYTLCTINEQPLQVETSTIINRSLSHTLAIQVIVGSDLWRRVLIPYSY